MNKRGGITTSLNRNKFGLIILVTAVMVGATLFGLSRWITIKIEGEKTIDFVNEWFPILRGSSNRVTHLITWIGNELEQLSQLEEIRDSGVNLESEIVDVTYRSLSNYISCLRRLDEEGNRVFGYHGECDPIDSTSFEGDRDYFLAAKRAKKLSTSDIYIDSEGQKRLRVVHPILRDGDNGDQEFAGALTMDVRVDEVQKMMIPPLSEDEREWLRVLWFDSNNRPIYFPGHPNIDGRAILEMDSYCRTCHDSSGAFASFDNRGQGWEIIEDGRGGKTVRLYTPVQFADQNWMIALCADYERVIAEAAGLANYIHFITALSCIIVLFGSVVSLSLVRARKTAEVRDQVIARESALLGKIKESEERYRTLFEGVRSGVYVSTPQGKFLDVNEAMVRMLGYDSREELLEIDIESDLYVLPDDRKSFKEKIEKHIVIEDHESCLRRKDGKHIICLETSYGRRDENGRIVEYLGVLIDITSRKRMEAELENSRYRLRELFDGASVAIFVEDMQGNILDVNRKAIELFGYGRDEFLEMHAIDLLAPEDARNFDLFWEALAKRGRIDLETRNRTKGGHFIDVEVIAQMVTMEKETLVQVFVRDVSEIRQKERELREKNEELNRMSEMKTQFVSLVSHELRTPMTAIKGSLDIIHGGAAGPIHEKQKMFISMARRNIDRLKEMVNNILDLSRIEAGKIEFEFREVDFQVPLNHVLLTLSATADENKVVLESHLPSELPTLYADEAKVEQILTNLIGNALKHTPPGGKVTVVADMAGERDMDRLKQVKKEVPSPNRYIRISVVDTGSGIPDDQLDAIFDRYKQLQGVKGEQGTGLGLAICRYMVEKQNGTVWAERGVRVGSVLSFLLPVYQGENPIHVNKQGSMSPTSSS